MAKTRRYQNEKPVGTDLFDGQGHEKVADAIANLLFNDSSQHIIGIEGNLGAGKSTVINILKHKVKDSGFQIVTFDADQYHMSLKPALIQTIEAELKTLLGSSKPDKFRTLTNAVETALGKRLEYTKTTTSHISFLTIAFAFLIGIAALQVKPFLMYLYQWAQHDLNPNQPSWLISFLLLISPVVVYASMKIFGVKTKLGDLVKRNSIDTISETIDINREVGAIELKEAFEVFAQLIPEGKSILLVIDNIDRISPDTVRELWSDVEILTSLGSEKFRILLPYSEVHLAKALERSSVDESHSGKEFISKRIPIPFSAPPIVTTGWREQFDKYWLHTLPDISGREGVKSLIDIWGEKVTPRYLKSLINRIGAKIDSCPENNDALNGACCGAYIMAVRDNDVTVNDLLSQLENNISLESKREPRELERKIKATHKVLNKYGDDREEWSKQISALHFQTSFEVAQSELIIEPIRVAVSSIDTEALLKLRPLMGFDVFFKKEIESTNSSDLIKLGSSLAECESGKELLQDYLPDINHELRNIETEDRDFDMELIKSYEVLDKHNIVVDLYLVRRLQQSAQKRVGQIWNSLTTHGFPTEAPNSSFQWTDLEEKIMQCYAYSSVTKSTPQFITKPKASFIVNALFPIEKKIQRWHILDAIRNIPTSELVHAACQRRKIFDNSSAIFPALLRQLKVGELQAIDSKKLIDKIDVNAENVTDLVQTAPFWQGWKEQKKNKLATQLAISLEKITPKSGIDDATLDAFIALVAASFIVSWKPTQSFSYRNYRNQNVSHQSATWLVTKMKERPKHSEYLLDYLSCCNFSDIIIWCNHQPVSEYILPYLERLIQNDRIYVMEISGLLRNDYLLLKNNFDVLSVEDLLRWMEKWASYASDPLSWIEEAIDDIIEFQSPKLMETIISYFDDASLTSDEWIARISDKHPYFKKFLSYFLRSNIKLKNQKALQQALKSLPQIPHDYDEEIIIELIELLDGNKRNGIRIAVTSNFLKTTTPHEQRCKSIAYFGGLFSIPSIKSDSAAAHEAIALMEDAIANSNVKEINWLLSQPIIGDGWGIDYWSKENLKLLFGVLNEHKLTSNSKLAKEAKKKLSVAKKSK